MKIKKHPEQFSFNSENEKSVDMRAIVIADYDDPKPFR